MAAGRYRRLTRRTTSAADWRRSDRSSSSGRTIFPTRSTSAAGGDFAAAIAAGNPVIAKGHSSHPSTTRLFAEEAFDAVKEVGLPPAFVQLIYRTSHEDGCRLVSHPAIGASGYTGARATGLVLKEAADRVGKPMYLELSSINPICVLPGGWRNARTNSRPSSRPVA